MKHIFICYAQQDIDFVTHLRETLEGLGLPVWLDARVVRGGEDLDAQRKAAIETARQVIVVFSPATANEIWIKEAIAHAEKIRASQHTRDFQGVMGEMVERDSLNQTVDTQAYHLKNIRTLLISGFDDKELRRLHYYEPDFKPLLEELASSMGLGDVVDKVINYALKKGLIKRLLTWAKEQNSVKYKRFQPYVLEASNRPNDDGTSEISPTAGSNSYRIIPLLLAGIKESALKLWFSQTPPKAIAVKADTAGGLNEVFNEALPAILAALGEQLPTDLQPLAVSSPQRVADLVLHLSDPTLTHKEGKRYLKAMAKVSFYPPQENRLPVESTRFYFIAPLGPIEAEDLTWYLERYHIWPIGIFEERAKEIEAKLPQWGQALYEAALDHKASQQALRGWQEAVTKAEGGKQKAKGGQVVPRFSVRVDSDLPDGCEADEQNAAHEAGSELLALPWELLHDGRGYLFQGNYAVRVRRQLPNRYHQPPQLTDLPIRILVVSPRPETKDVGYIDHRVSALPLIEAVEALGNLVSVTLLNTPTYPALEQTLQQAMDEGAAFDVIHFDGHGLYSKKHGLGGLCFEAPEDTNKLYKRGVKIIFADKLANIIRHYRIPLVVLEACQSARSEQDPAASVAARLLEEGVSSVVAMSHSVLVETARRFIIAFYKALAKGSNVGQAMLKGQQALHSDTYRGERPGAGPLHLQDWFVPVLYQEKRDPHLFSRQLPQSAQKIQQDRNRRRLGALPPTPAHQFVGRSRDLLALERHLSQKQYAVVIGQGGAGKTTLAVECARWLVRSHRFAQTAFISLDLTQDVRTVVDKLGQQLLPHSNWSVAQYPTLKEAFQPLARALTETPTLIIFDNMESVLPPPNPSASIPSAKKEPQPPQSAVGGQRSAVGSFQQSVARGAALATESFPLDELLTLAQDCLNTHPATRIVFTSREALPAPFNERGYTIPLGALSQTEAIKLVKQVLEQQNITLNPPSRSTTTDDTEQALNALVQAVNCHPRALVLLAPELARQGISLSHLHTTTTTLQDIMHTLEKKHPNDRQNSLFASVELSLRRLPPSLRAQVDVLRVFEGGAHLWVIAQLLKVEMEAAKPLAIALIDVGLATDMGYGHLRLDPALPAYLRISPPSVPPNGGEAMDDTLQTTYAHAMMELTHFLYQQRFQDAKLAHQLTLLELPNLLALLSWLVRNGEATEIIDIAGRIEQLIAPLGRPKALAYVIAVREKVGQTLETWNRAKFLVETQRVDRYLEQGHLQQAYTLTQQLLQQALQHGPGAYAGADYDCAMLYIRLGQILKKSGNAQAALEPLNGACRRFEALAQAGNSNAERMVSVTLTEIGDCWTDLGQLAEAAKAYEEAIGYDEKRGRMRDVAVNTGQLATVRMYQKDYETALRLHAETRAIFEQLGEAGSVATIWHQMGMVYKRAKQFEAAEEAYKQALAIKVQQKNRAGEASSLGELGNLYDAMGRLEEAVAFYRQAGEIYVALDDLIKEGMVRSNIADTLLKLGRYEEARPELKRAIECGKAFGHVAEPWKTWAILYELEKATHHPQAASHAWRQARDSYVAYRKFGGESKTPAGQVCGMVAQALAQKQTEEVDKLLTDLSNHPDASKENKLFFHKLQQVLAGKATSALADDEGLDYDDAGELLLLVEKVNNTTTK